MRVFHDHVVWDGARRFRGCQVRSVTASSLALRVVLDPNFVGDRVVSRSLAPAAIVGDALCAEITSGTGADSYVFGALYETRHAAPHATNDVTQGFFPGRIPEALSGDPGTIPWYAGLQRDRSTSD